jgi:hypothetical protein
LPAKWLAADVFSLFSGTATHARSGKYRRTGGPLRATSTRSRPCPKNPNPSFSWPAASRALPGVAPAGQLDTSERAELTLVLLRRAEIPADIVEGPTVLTGDQLAERYGADPADVGLVRRTLTGLGRPPA